CTRCRLPATGLRLSTGIRPRSLTEPRNAPSICATASTLFTADAGPCTWAAPMYDPGLFEAMPTPTLRIGTTLVMSLFFALLLAISELMASLICTPYVFTTYPIPKSLMAWMIRFPCPTAGCTIPPTTSPAISATATTAPACVRIAASHPLDCLTHAARPLRGDPCVHPAVPRLALLIDPDDVPLPLTPDPHLRRT